MRIATISICSESASMERMRQHARAVDAGAADLGEYFDFESPATLFRVLTPERWEILGALQRLGPHTAVALARGLRREAHAVRRDLTSLVATGLVERDGRGRFVVPFGEIRTDFVLRAAA